MQSQEYLFSFFGLLTNEQQTLQKRNINLNSYKTQVQYASLWFMQFYTYQKISVIADIFTFFLSPYT